MKPGLGPGVEAALTLTVQPDMTPGFAPYAVYSTYRMARDCEWAARMVILPYLEEDEEGVGAGLRLRHEGAAGVGSTVVVTARCAAVRGPLVVCRVEVRRGPDRCARGVVHQLLLPAAEVHSSLR